MSKKLTNEKQINFIITYLKPMLQSDNIKDARLVTALGLSGKNDVQLNEDDRIEILTWMYKSLGPKEYFKNSNTIFPWEFSYYIDKNFVFSNNIQTIQQYAFANSNIRKLIIPNTIKAIDDYVFMDSSITEVVFENFSQIKFGHGVFAGSDLSMIYVEDNYDNAKLQEFHERYPQIDIVLSSTGEVLIEANN